MPVTQQVLDGYRARLSANVVPPMDLGEARTYVGVLLAEVERLRNVIAWYADEQNYDEIGRPGNYVAASTAGGFIQDPDWDTDDGWRAARALATTE